MPEEQSSWDELREGIEKMVETNDEARERMELVFGSMDAFFQRLEEKRSERRVKYRQELLYAYSMWSDRLPQAQIFEGLEQSKAHESVSLRTVATWLTWFKELTLVEAEQDRHLIHFHNLSDWGIPYEKYSDLKRLERGRSTRLTPRMAKWMLRLQLVRVQQGRGEVPLAQEKIMKFTKQYVEAEQLEMLKVYNSSGITKSSTSMEVEVEMIGAQNES